MNRLRRLLGSTDRKLSAVLLLLLAALGAGFVAVGAVTTRNHVDEVEQRLNRDLALHLVAEEPLFEAGAIDRDALEHVFHTLMVINPRIECYLLDPDGRLLAWNAPEGRVRLDRVALEPIAEFLGGAPLPLRGDDPRHPERRKIFSVAPISASAGGRTDGFLYVVLAGEQYASLADRLASSYILRESLTLALVVILVTALVGALLFRVLTRRLRALDQRLRDFGASDFAEPPPSASVTSGIPDEIDRLDRSFERMADRMAEHVDQIAGADRLRRELVTNVSHDLRTPIATLKGYLETLLLKEGALTAQDSHRYLEIALAQSERLARLVEELFELARLDCGDVVLQRERFSLAELAQDVAHKFSLGAAERGIRLDTELETSTPWVEGDLRLIERTLENLIDNALRHTDDGGQVRVTVTAGDGQVRLAVSDSGCGIAEDEIPRVFERFYRGRAARANGNAERGGAGLGLAIASRVIELHQSSISVRSRHGEGTRFSFALAGAPSLNVTET